MTKGWKGKRAAGISIVLGSIVFAAAVSHAMNWWLGVNERQGGVHVMSEGGEGESAVAVAGSSLAAMGVDWKSVGESAGLGLVRVAVPASSPAETEALLEAEGLDGGLICGVSIFDLNEYALSDYRAMITPLGVTIGDLRASQPPGEIVGETLSLYGQESARKVFPTLGHSTRTMVLIREKLRALRSPGGSGDGGGGGDGGEDERAGEVISVSGLQTETLSDWDQGRLQRRMGELEASGQTRGPVFRGPKNLALERMVRARVKDGIPVVLVVLPLSATFEGAYTSEDAVRRFEGRLARYGELGAGIIRLDRIAELQSDAAFADLVHLNLRGREVATKAVIEELPELMRP